jgi:hypothetical protein
MGSGDFGVTARGMGGECDPDEANARLKKAVTRESSEWTARGTRSLGCDGEGERADAG